MEKKTYTHKVNYYETDRMGITHHSNYIRWMEEARCYFFDENGWPYKKSEEEGIFSPVVSVDCKYKDTTTFADEVEIDVELLSYSGVKMTLKYEMRNKKTGKICAIGQSQHCFIDAATGRPKNMVKINAEFDKIMRG